MVKRLPQISCYSPTLADLLRQLNLLFSSAINYFLPLFAGLWRFFAVLPPLNLIENVVKLRDLCNIFSRNQGLLS